MNRRLASYLVSDCVDSLGIAFRMDFAPGKVTVTIAQSIEIAQTFHAPDISVEQEVDQTIVAGVSNSRQSIQKNLAIILLKSLKTI